MQQTAALAPFLMLGLITKEIKPGRSVVLQFERPTRSRAMGPEMKTRR